jgi:hypothetical protein
VIFSFLAPKIKTKFLFYLMITIRILLLKAGNFTETLQCEINLLSEENLILRDKN